MDFRRYLIGDDGKQLQWFPDRSGHARYGHGRCRLSLGSPLAHRRRGVGWNHDPELQSGGNFQQNEYALSAYAAYVGRPLWFAMTASYGGLHYDTNRVAPIGIATISNTGSTDGSNMSFGSEIGYNFTTGVSGWWDHPALLPMKGPPSSGLYITHGPVAGIILQQIYVNGFSETDQFSGDAVDGFTALSYAGQVRIPAVTESGYQASTDIGI